MTEQERAAALADEIADSELVLSPLSGGRDLRVATAAEKAAIIEALRGYTAGPAVRATVLAEIEWIILGCSQVEHKPAWVVEAAELIVEKIGSRPAAVVTDEMVENAAKSDAIFDGRGWAAMPKTDRERYMRRSRAALEAALGKEPANG